MSAEFDKNGDLWVPVRVRSMANAPATVQQQLTAHIGVDGDAVRYVNLTAYIRSVALADRLAALE